MTRFPDLPGPRGLPILGNLRDFDRNRLAFLIRNREQYGDVAHFRIAGRHLYQINHPDLIQEILVQKPEKFHKSPLLKRVTREVLGQGLLTSDGDFHKRQRKLVQPAFHHARVAAYGEVMVAQTLRMLEGWQAEATASTPQPLHIDREMMRLTLGIVAKTLFDADVSNQADEIGDVITQAIRIAATRIRRVPILDWLPTAANRERRAGIAKLDAVILRFIEARRASGEDKGDLLSMLLMAADDQGQMTTEQVRAEAMTLFIAGHETTANALSWTWYLLAQHPDAVARLHQELDAVLGGRLPTVADLPALRYTEMILKESMRLYPPAWLITRRVHEAVQIGPHAFPPNALLMMSPYVLHHDGRYFAEPERFLPGRWEGDLEKRIPRYAYFPFGGGPRICIGNSFAMMEATLILATIAQRFDLSLASAAPVDPEPLITLRPKQPILMHAAQRQRAATFA